MILLWCRLAAECAFGMNIFKVLFAAVRDADVRDIVGGRSKAVQNTLQN